LRRTLLSVVLFLFGSVPFANAQSAATPVKSLLEIRYDQVVLQQWDVSCGAAALSTVLSYHYNDPVPEKAIAQAMLERGDPRRIQAQGGFSMLDLKHYAEGRGYEGRGYGHLTLEDLAAFGAAIVPVRFQDYDHFVVFQGVRNGRVELADPAFGNRTVSVREFERAWRDNLALVVALPEASSSDYHPAAAHVSSRSGR
jgi:uncharacterized protein